MSEYAAFDFIQNPSGRPLDDASFLSSAIAQEKEKNEPTISPAFAIPIIAAIIIVFLAFRKVKR